MPEQIPAPLSQDELNRLFPLTRPISIKPNSFEIGLTLGGTVSAGAYTAGVLDYLMEALDAWTRAKEDGDSEAPTHDAVITTISGASGGAINGAILMRLAGWYFPHGAVKDNPFYDLWVNGAGLQELLGSTEPGITGFSALFNTTSFADLANNIIRTTGEPLGTDANSPRQRSYLGDPLRLFAMVGNVTGVPYQIKFRGQSGLGHDLVSHADYVRFGLTIPGGVANGPGIRPDEIALSSGSPVSWNLLSDAALATCAFPAAFRARPLQRELASMGYRVVGVPGEEAGTMEIAQLYPCWTAMTQDGRNPNVYRTANVDGGTFNNEPLNFARIALSGLAGRNRRDGNAADRGIVLVDPFSDAEQVTLYDPPGFFGLLGPLITALIRQARFKPEDIALASDYETYSRFLVAPVGPGHDGVQKVGSSVIASGGLGGFLGFIDKRFLDYDFRLGRRNAYEFLTNQLMLPVGNPLFKDISTAQLNIHSAPDKSPVTGKVENFLPIIPLMKKLRENPPPALTAADWPKLTGPLTKLPDQITARLNVIYDGIKREAKSSWWPGGVGGFAADTAWKLFLRGILRDIFVKQIATGLRNQNLN